MSVLYCYCLKKKQKTTLHLKYLGYACIKLNLKELFVGLPKVFCESFVCHDKAYALHVILTIAN